MNEPYGRELARAENSKSAPHISPGADRGANSSKMIKSTPIEFQSENIFFVKRRTVRTITFFFWIGRAQAGPPNNYISLKKIMIPAGFFHLQPRGNN